MKIRVFFRSLKIEDKKINKIAITVPYWLVGRLLFFGITVVLPMQLTIIFPTLTVHAGIDYRVLVLSCSQNRNVNI